MRARRLIGLDASDRRAADSGQGARESRLISSKADRPAPRKADGSNNVNWLFAISVADDQIRVTLPTAGYRAQFVKQLGLLLAREPLLLAEVRMGVAIGETWAAAASEERPKTDARKGRL